MTSMPGRLTLRCAVVIVQDGGDAVEDGTVELAGADVDAEERREDEVEEEVEHGRMVCRSC